MNSRKHLRTILFTASFGATLLAGCGSTAPGVMVTPLTNEQIAGVGAQPEYLRPLFSKLYAEGSRNEVLNRLEIGSAALFYGDIDKARENFDLALTIIESTYANTENALKARSLWHEEGRKDFRGEPYERAMAYYYRGLIYIIDGEYDNARASFLSGLMQDAFAEEEQNRSDFLLMMYLIGWSSQKMGSDHLARDAWQELQTFLPDFVPPDPADNVLVLAETGAAPRKLADGVGHYQLVYRRGRNFQEKQVALSTENISLNPKPIEDIYFQASTRGGRPVDAIIEGKAKFRAVNDSMGSALADLGTTTRVFSPLLGGDSAQISNALALVGVTHLMLASNTVPRADTRYWQRLPDIIHIESTKLSTETFSDPLQWSMSYLDLEGKPIDSVAGATHTYKSKDNIIIWHKSREL